METFETVIWATMLGGLLTIGAVALVDAIVTRNLAAWRGLIFMSITGFSFILMSGLPEDLVPQLPPVPVLILKSTLGPLSGAMVLLYLKQWLGEAAEDRLVHLTIQWGTTALLAATMAITVVCALQAETAETMILQFAAFANAASVLLAALASLRAARLGDQLARSMTVGCVVLAIALAGLNAHQLLPGQTGPWVWVLSGISTVTFFLIMVSLGVRHNQQIRNLERLAGLTQGVDPATGLPRGSVLLAKLDDAFWRSTRLGTQCAVICLHLRNLYELSEVAGHSSDQQILAALSARIRRAMGFRCLVGLYHPRCFVVVITAVKQPRVVPKIVARLQDIMGRPLQVVGSNDSLHPFVPQIYAGAIIVNTEQAVPGDIIDEAEQLALDQEREINRTAATVQGSL